LRVIEFSGYLLYTISVLKIYKTFKADYNVAFA